MLINLELTQYSGVHGLSLVGFPLNLRLTQLDWILEPCTRCKVMEYGLSIEKKKKRKKKKRTVRSIESNIAFNGGSFVSYLKSSLNFDEISLD